jgi:hypothetical protein
MLAGLDRPLSPCFLSRFDSPNDEPRLGRYGKAAGLLIIFTGGFAVNALRLPQKLWQLGDIGRDPRLIFMPSSLGQILLNLVIS